MPATGAAKCAHTSQCTEPAPPGAEARGAHKAPGTGGPRPPERQPLCAKCIVGQGLRERGAAEPWDLQMGREEHFNIICFPGTKTHVNQSYNTTEQSVSVGGLLAKQEK